MNLFPPAVPPPGPLQQPTRTILPVGPPARFQVPLPSGGALTCQVTTQVKPGGQIALHLTTQIPGVARPFVNDVRLWDSVPGVLLLPTPTGAMSVLLDAYLDFPPPDSNPTPMPPFPFVAPQGQQGSLIAGQVVVKGQPLRFGTARMEITGDDPTPPASLVVPLDDRGQFQFANVRAGKYTIRLLEASAYFSPFTQPLDFAAYARARWHIENPVWESDRQTLTVRKGGLTRLADWSLKGTERAATQPEMQANSVSSPEGAIQGR